MRLQFSYDETNDVLTVEGIRYSGELFRTLGFGAIGSVLRLVERKDGVVVMMQENNAT